MIFSKEGLITVEGRRVELLSELGIIVKELHEECNISSDEIRRSVEIGMLSSEELDRLHKRVTER